MTATTHITTRDLKAAQDILKEINGTTFRVYERTDKEPYEKGPHFKVSEKPGHALLAGLNTLGFYEGTDGSGSAILASLKAVLSKIHHNSFDPAKMADRRQWYAGIIGVQLMADRLQDYISTRLPAPSAEFPVSQNVQEHRGQLRVAAKANIAVLGTIRNQLLEMSRSMGLRDNMTMVSWAGENLVEGEHENAPGAFNPKTSRKMVALLLGPEAVVAHARETGVLPPRLGYVKGHIRTEQVVFDSPQPPVEAPKGAPDDKAAQVRSERTTGVGAKR